MADLPELVGRRPELARLVDVLVGRGSYSSAVVAGEAGVGKSRLTTEAIADASREGVSVLVGYCLPLTEHLPLLPVQHVLTAIANLGDGSLLRDALHALAPELRLELQRLTPDLVTEPEPRRELETDKSWRRRQLYDAVRQVMVHASRHARLSMVVEDIHWGDPPTLDLLEYLLAPGGPSLPLVVTWRSGEPPAAAIDAWLAWVRRQPGLRFEELGPLDLQETTAQAVGVLGQPLSREQVRQVFARSEGNPLFTEQLVTFLHSSSGSTAAGSSRGLPSQLQDLLLARVAQVSGPASEVMSCLAVAGRPVGEDVLSSCCSLEMRQVREAVRALGLARLLRAPDELGAFQLRHGLLAEAVREALLPGERREWHLRLARTLIDEGHATSSGEIAEHYRAAGDAGSELAWRVRAGQQADQVYAFTQSADHWLRAIELIESISSPSLPDGCSPLMVYAAASDALESDARHIEAGQVAEQALQHLLSGADTATAAELLARVGHFRKVDNPVAGRAALTDAIRLYESLPPSPGYLRAVAYYADAVRERDDIDVAAVLLDRALGVAHEVAPSPYEEDLIKERAWIHLTQGDPDLALQLIENSWKIRRPDPRVAVSRALFHAAILLDLGRLLDVVRAAERADLAGWTQSGRPETHETAVLRSNVFAAWLMLGDTEAAAQVVEPFITAHPTWDTALLHLDGAILAMLRDDLSAAETGIAQAEALVAPDGETHYYAERWQIELELWQHRPASAEQRALRTLNGLARMVPTGHSGTVLVLGARASADQCERRSFSSTPMVAAKRAALQQLHDGMPVDPFVPGPLAPTAAADLLAWDAEWARARGDATADQWADVAAEYRAVTRPHLEAYCRWRQADVLLAHRDQKRQAADVLHDAARLATGHAPLLGAINDLATRARIDLTLQTSSPAVPAAPYGLTPRELTVLRLLSQGRSNGQIGAELFISTKTASVHVSNILRKMQVPSRVAAASLASQIDLFEGRSGERSASEA